MVRRKSLVPRTPDGIPIIFHSQFGAKERVSSINAIYDDRYVRELCREYRIESESHVAGLWDFLKFAASVYFIERANQEKMGARPSVSDLNRIARLSSSLAGILDSLDPKADAALWQAGGHFSERANNDRAERPRKSDLLIALNLLAEHAHYATEHLPKGKAGRPYEYALWIWTVNAQAFWSQSLGRKFSLDTHKGQPVSEAARFCRDALQPLAPHVDFKSLAYTMRAAIGRSRKS